MEPVILEPKLGQAAACEPILRALPEWFGIEDAIQQFLHEIATLPTFLCIVEHTAVAFLSVKQHYPSAAELYVLGVSPTYHRRGIGRRLVSSAETYLQQQAVAFVQVKTLGPSQPDRAYEQTRAFYVALGYHPLEEFTTIWSPENPCLILIKHLG